MRSPVFRLLGPFEIAVPGRPLRLSRLEAGLAALLALAAGRVVPVDRIVDVLWGQTPPGSARNRVQALVSGLRRTLGDAGTVVITEPGGYRLDTGGCQVDLVEFEGRLAEARKLVATNRLAEASDQFRAALALWRGEALTGVANLDAEAVWLTEARMTALHERFEVDLALGKHTDLVGELTSLTAAHPTRETLTAQLMLALYRSGRQAEALGAFARFRRLLADEFGLEPGPALTHLQERILRRDRVLDLAPDEPIGPHEPPGSTEPPAQLPHDLPDFTGRGIDLGQILAHVGAGRAVAICAIDGMAGVGKTALAVRAAHRLADRYPDGQLFLDLRAHSAGADVVDPAAALDFLLRSIGVPPDRVPPTLDERAAVWRTELARRRLLIVLDNAAAADQIRPLLPGAGDCLVVITSRRRLATLDGIRQHSVDVLPTDEAAALLVTVAGPRAAAEPDAVAEVVRLCGQLPLAIRIAAARLRNRPRWTVAHLAARLRERPSRLVELSTDDRGVSSALDLSYRHLGADERRLFRLLGLHPGADVDAYSAAALADVPAEKAEVLLEALLDVHLVSQHAVGRYRFHDLVREYARVVADAEEPEPGRRAAIGRLLDYYFHVVNLACDQLEPTRRRLDPTIAVATGQPAGTPAVDDVCGALLWLDTERANLVSVVHHAANHGWPRHCWQLAHALRAYYMLQGHVDDSLATHGDALRATRHLGDRWAEATVLNDLGTLQTMAGNDSDAMDRCRQALAIRREIGDRYGVASTLTNIGGTLANLGRRDEALDLSRQGLLLFREIGEAYGQAAALGNIGSILADLERYAEALEPQRQALAICRELGHRRSEATVLAMMARAHRMLGEHDAAFDLLRQALAICRELGDRYGEAKRLTALGHLYLETGDDTTALDCFRLAFAIARATGNRIDEGHAREGLEKALAARGDHVPVSSAPRAGQTSTEWPANSATVVAGTRR